MAVGGGGSTHGCGWRRFHAWLWVVEVPRMAVGGGSSNYGCGEVPHMATLF